jgi:hypothetical protein
MCFVTALEIFQDGKLSVQNKYGCFAMLSMTRVKKMGGKLPLTI